MYTSHKCTMITKMMYLLFLHCDLKIINLTNPFTFGQQDKMDSIKTVKVNCAGKELIEELLDFWFEDRPEILPESHNNFIMSNRAR